MRFSHLACASTVIGGRVEGESKRGPKAHLARKKRRQGRAKTCSYLGYAAKSCAAIDGKSSLKMYDYVFLKREDKMKKFAHRENLASRVFNK